jgi:hypothetical protein
MGPIDHIVPGDRSLNILAEMLSGKHKQMQVNLAQQAVFLLP